MTPSAFLAKAFTGRQGLPPLVIVLALLLSGCGTIKAYEGPELTKSEISVIDSRHSHGWMVAFMGVLPIPLSIRHSTIVLIVDGHKGRGVYPYHVLPGQHTARFVTLGLPQWTCVAHLRGLGGVFSNTKPV